MAKKQKTGAQPNEAITNTATPKSTPADKAQQEPLSLLSFKVQAVIIAVIGIIFYFNSFSNEYALDDRPIVVQNEYVKQGFAGIPKILTSDAFESYFQQQNSGNALAGGRYRPFSIVTFAIEQQLLGKPVADTRDEKTKMNEGNLPSPEETAKTNFDMHVRHVVNVLLYIGSILVLLTLLRKIVFPENRIIPFVACLLFLIHPIHTEVVSNVKSRDEILSLMFIGLTFIYTFKYRDDNNKKDLYKALGCYFIALLSKEYGIALVFLLPLSLYLFRKDTIADAFKRFIPFLIPLGLYFIFRLGSEKNANAAGVPDDIMNIPYLFATPVQKIASIISVLFKYFELLVFPHPLSSDYSYRQIPYRDFSYPGFWISLAFYGALVFALIQTFLKRHVLCFAIAIYLFNLGLIGNILVDIGAPMGERLIYHSSFGFAIALAWLLYYAFDKIKPFKSGMVMLGVVVVALTGLCAFKTIDRNKDWKNDRTLFLHDVNNSPNSVLILGNAGSASIDIADSEKDSVKKNELYRQAIKYFDKALSINNRFANGYENRGVAYYKLGFTDIAVANWDSTRLIHPGHPELPYVYSIASNYYYRDGLKYGKSGQHELAIEAFRKAAHCKPMEPDIWYNLGFANMMGKHYEAAVNAFQNSLRFNSKNPNARKYLEQCKGFIAQPQTAQPQ